jgi:hypothetical protein
VTRAVVIIAIGVRTWITVETSVSDLSIPGRHSPDLEPCSPSHTAILGIGYR